MCRFESYPEINVDAAMKSLGCPCRKLDSQVLVMQSIKDRARRQTGQPLSWTAVIGTIVTQGWRELGWMAFVPLAVRRRGHLGKLEEPRRRMGAHLCNTDHPCQ